MLPVLPFVIGGVVGLVAGVVVKTIMDSQDDLSLTDEYTYDDTTETNIFDELDPTEDEHRKERDSFSMF